MFTLQSLEENRHLQGVIPEADAYNSSAELSPRNPDFSPLHTAEVCSDQQKWRQLYHGCLESGKMFCISGV